MKNETFSISKKQIQLNFHHCVRKSHHALSLCIMMLNIKSEGNSPKQEKSNQMP